MDNIPVEYEAELNRRNEEEVETLEDNSPWEDRTDEDEE